MTGLCESCRRNNISALHILCVCLSGCLGLEGSLWVVLLCNCIGSLACQSPFFFGGGGGSVGCRFLLICCVNVLVS